MALKGRRPTGLLLGGVVCAVAAGLGIDAITGGRQDRVVPAETPPAVANSFVAARNGVCAAADRAHQGDVGAARTAFYDRSHRPLHDLAAAVHGNDRVAAARLLEAKERVETAFGESSPRLAGALDSLAESTGSAMAATGGADPGPCHE